MTRDTPFGTIATDEYGCDCRIHADADQLYAWAHRPGQWWPCSTLTRYRRVIVELADNGDLVNLDTYMPGNRYADDHPDIPADELNAWIDDVLTADPGSLAHLTLTEEN